MGKYLDGGKNPRSGEPMKPLSEFLEEFPHENWWGEHDPKRCRRCKLQAWLREADKELVELSNHNVVTVSGATTWTEFIRTELLGTTRTEDGK